MKSSTPKPPTVHSMRAQLKKSPHWASFLKFISMVDDLDHGVGVPELISPENPKGMSRPSLDVIHAHLADLIFVGRCNKAAVGMMQKKTARPSNILPRFRPVRFLRHFIEEQNLYICGRHDVRHRGGKAYLFVFDVDDKDGTAGDVLEVATLINEALGVRLWWEPSTGGRGLHGWAVVLWQGTSSAYAKWTSDWAARAGAYLAEQGCKATVEVKGMPPVCSGQGLGRVYEQAGTLIKAPRLRTNEEFDSFFSGLRFVPADEIDSMWGMEPSLPSISPADHMLSRAAPEGGSTDNRYGRFEDSTPEPTPEQRWAYLDHSRKAGGESERVALLLHSGNPFVSRYGAILTALQRHGGHATPAIAQSIYENEGRATGPANRERIRWFERRLPRFLRKYDPTLRHRPDPTWFTSKDKVALAEVLGPLLVENGYALRRNKGRPFVDVEDLAVLALLIRASMQRVGYFNYGGAKTFYRLAGETISGERITRYIRVLEAIGKLKVLSKPVQRSVEEGKVKLGQSGRYEWVEHAAPEGGSTDNRYGRIDERPSRRRAPVVTVTSVDWDAA